MLALLRTTEPIRRPVAVFEASLAATQRAGTAGNRKTLNGIPLCVLLKDILGRVNAAIFFGANIGGAFLRLVPVSNAFHIWLIQSQHTAVAVIDVPML
jgi:hypothetical protein